jgi:integrase
MLVRTPAGIERAPDLPTATMRQVFDLAGLVPARFRALVLLAAFTSLRYGELAALRRRGFDSHRGTLSVHATLTERPTFKPPKTDAGTRIVAVPTAIRRDLLDYLLDYTINDPDALIFTGTKGAALRRSNFQRSWQRRRWTRRSLR